MTNPTHFHSRQRRPLSGRSDTNNMDEKKDCSDFESEASAQMVSDVWQDSSFVVEGGGGSSTQFMTSPSAMDAGTDRIVERQPTTTIGYLPYQGGDDVSHQQQQQQQQGRSYAVDHGDVEEVRRDVPTTSTTSTTSTATTEASTNGNSGLHHRHHFNQSHFSPETPGHHHSTYLVQQTSSPNRRRRGRSRGNNMDKLHNPIQHHHPHSHNPHHSHNPNHSLPHHSHSPHYNTRRRKWTAMQVFRCSLLVGAALYFVVMLRGTQILMQQNEAAASDENQEPTTQGRLVDYFPLQLPAGYVSHPAIQGYLRSAAKVSIESLAPFIHRSTNDAPEEVKRAIQKRVAERRKRTRPPAPQPKAADIADYVIVPAEKRLTQTYQQRQRQVHARSQSLSAVAEESEGEEEEEEALATETQLCGVHARRARTNNPESFLERDALMSSEARVLITGIISNPLAFHLALTLRQRCGVEVLLGIDPMLPNTIQSRVDFMEQMQILASNVPKMQPIVVPVLGLHPRMKKSKKESAENPILLELTDELNLHLNFEPTHIVHLSAATYQNPVSTNSPQSPMAPKRPLSPYQISKDDSYEPSLFQIRSSMMAMEQVLASVVSSMEEEEGKDSAPHVTYASATMSRSSSTIKKDVILSYSKLIDEVLADTYHDLFGAYSVGVRIPPNAIYGPWDRGTKLHKLLQEAINGNFTTPSDNLGDQELIYVQDGVDAIINAMQYRESKATHFELNGNSAVSLSKVPSLAESLLTFKPTTTTSVEAPLQHVNNDSSERTLQKLHWKPGTTLRDGVLKTMAWLLDRASPYGPAPKTGTTNQPSARSPPIGTGDALLLANSAQTCPADDLGCHAGPAYLPCVSECSTKAQCQPSIFDSVQQLAREMTEGCDAVLYTQSLGRDVEDMQLQSQFEDDVEPAICNLAFVAQSSPLVKAVIEKIPQEELQRLGAIAPFDDKLKKLNGRLLYRGWILIWVDVVDLVPLADSSLLKLSPGRMFSEDVLYAVFVEENFTVSPTTDDVRFLISQMDRGATKQRNIYRMMKDEHSKAKKVKFTIPAQPEKRSSILLSQLKFKISDRGRIPQDTKISIMDAVRFMRFEIGSDPTKQKESSAIKRQKEFYRRISTFVNGKDLRDSFEPIYKYEIKHWVRTRWVVHDLTLEESRQLRCDWYQEHVQWGSEIDQLSFAAVMARKILDRRMTLLEPDDRTKHQAPAMTELKDVTDHNEWFAMATEHNRMHVSGGHSPSLQEVIGDKEEGDEEAAEEGPDVSAGSGYYHEKKTEVGLYVRIISDRIMSLSRKAWAKYRAEMAQQGGKI